MIRAYKFRMYPTSKQEDLLRAMLADHCFLYNAALEARAGAWTRSHVGIRYADETGQLTAIRAYDPDYARWSFTSQMGTLRRLERAFQGFFRRVKAGETPGYPRWKKSGRFNTVVHRNGDGAKWDSVPHPTQTRVYFQGIGHVRVRQHRPVTGRVKTVSVKREGKHWYVVLAVEQDLPAPLPKTGAVVGLDLATGSNGLAYTSLGERIGNPAYGKVSLEKLADAQRAVKRTKPGSNRNRKARGRVAGMHRKTRNQRHDYLHKAAHQLVARYDVIVAEKLTIAGMTRRAAPRPDGAGGYEPNGGSAKTGLNRSILDAGWGILLGMIRAKAESAGRQLILVNPAYTSQTCSECGHREAANRNGKDFLCLSCGHRDDADVNAAVNILRAGLVLRDTAKAVSRENLSGSGGVTASQSGEVTSALLLDRARRHAQGELIDS
ncbi:transposase [Arthrobacter sp. 49Tsu3.1M3]|uniref:RNA-guided endonuclease InsQ/TnpB family protein n=1 Tax=Arthrobacter sp. 49Tsu3.1M3 TaxID=1279029 RepID=UPI0009D27CF8|nr:transposase [Arthrobacter sp. 49Tsu3.1M3]SKB44157.1 transposase [Arthrobacter sp. 49Tsu3.1M3]